MTPRKPLPCGHDPDTAWQRERTCTTCAQWCEHEERRGDEKRDEPLGFIELDPDPGEFDLNWD